MIDINNVKVAFFDFDGTLVDSERIYNKYWCLAAKQSGYNLSFEQALYLRSLDKTLAKNYFIKLFKNDIYEEIRKSRRSLMKNEKTIFEKKIGVNEILNFLANKKIDSYIVTSSSKENCSESLKKSDIDPKFFKDIITVSQVENGKPFSDVYLYAVKIACSKADECIVFEDSPNGVKSAFSAGCLVCMIPDLSTPNEETKKMCSEIVTSFNEFVEKRINK